MVYRVNIFLIVYIQLTNLNLLNSNYNIKIHRYKNKKKKISKKYYFVFIQVNRIIYHFCV